MSWWGEQSPARKFMTGLGGFVVGAAGVLAGFNAFVKELPTPSLPATRTYVDERIKNLTETLAKDREATRTSRRAAMNVLLRAAAARRDSIFNKIQDMEAQFKKAPANQKELLTIIIKKYKEDLVEAETEVAELQKLLKTS